MMQEITSKPWMAITPPRKSVCGSRDQAERADFDSAFEATFLQQWDPICRTLFRLTGDWDEAEDLALETFLQLYCNPPSDETNLTGWLYRVAVNRGLNALRGRKRRIMYEHQAGNEAIQENFPADPAGEVERKLDQEKVRSALVEIRPRSAHLLVLRYSGLSYLEIAETLKISRGSVGTLLARAELEFQQVYKKAD